MNISSIEVIKNFPWCKKYGIDHVDIKISNDAVMILNSYKIKRYKHMAEVIDCIKSYGEYTIVNNISNIMLIAEWRCHNLLHFLGIEKERTASCDLNNEKPHRRFLYLLGSLFYFGF